MKKNLRFETAGELIIKRVKDFRREPLWPNG